jgi:hypothetical protein
VRLRIASLLLASLTAWQVEVCVRVGLATITKPELRANSIPCEGKPCPPQQQPLPKATSR